MNRRLAALALLAATTASGMAQAAQHPAQLYLQYCVGCHLADGTGRPDKGIPSLRRDLAWLARRPDGRAYLLRVPGVASSGLSDRELTDLMNWLLATYGAQGTPRAAPFTSEEIARERLHPVRDAAARRPTTRESAPR